MSLISPGFKKSKSVFTTTDETLPGEDASVERVDNNRFLVKYALKDLGPFILVNIERKENRVVYKLFNPQEKKTILLDKRLFEFFFIKGSR